MESEIKNFEILHNENDSKVKRDQLAWPDHLDLAAHLCRHTQPTSAQFHQTPDIPVLCAQQCKLWSPWNRTAQVDSESTTQDKP